MVTHKSYEAVGNALRECKNRLRDSERSKGDTIANARELADVLEKFGIRFLCLEFDSLKAIGICGILTVESHTKKRRKVYHYVVAVRLKGEWFILDPAAGTSLGPSGSVKRQVVRESGKGILVTPDAVAGEKEYKPQSGERSFVIQSGPLAEFVMRL
jgi:hypothetical protein